MFAGYYFPPPSHFLKNTKVCMLCNPLGKKLKLRNMLQATSFLSLITLHTTCLSYISISISIKWQHFVEPTSSRYSLKTFFTNVSSRLVVIWKKSTLGLSPDPWRKNVPVINQTELANENWFSSTPSSPAQGGGASHSLGVNLATTKSVKQTIK